MDSGLNKNILSNALLENGRQISHFIRRLANYFFSAEYRELTRIRKLPRYVSHETFLLGKLLKIIDGASFVFSYDEIFKKGLYSFPSKHEKPVIIDCGSNIGLSIIFFKTLYPESSIIAFEPDPKIFKVLEDNITSFELKNVALHNTCVWNEKTMLQFNSEGADAGRISSFDSVNTGNYEVKTIRLRDFLKQHVDFLKIDIEGAETIVLKDCADLLKNTDHLFVEYHSFENQKQSIHEIMTILHEAGFRIYASNPEYSFQPFVKRKSDKGMDFQINIFAYRT